MTNWIDGPPKGFPKEFSYPIYWRPWQDTDVEFSIYEIEYNGVVTQHTVRKGQTNEGPQLVFDKPLPIPALHSSARVVRHKIPASETMSDNFDNQLGFMGVARAIGDCDCLGGGPAPDICCACEFHIIKAAKFYKTGMGREAWNQSQDRAKNWLYTLKDYKLSHGNRSDGNFFVLEHNGQKFIGIYLYNVLLAALQFALKDHP